MEKAIRKIFVVGGQSGYAKWMQGTLVPTMEEADLVVFTGGEDINPALYGARSGRHTRYNESRDNHEIAAYDKAVILGKFIWGTCRGAQFVCAMNGGRLIQDMSHPSWHKFTNYDGKEYDVTSAHHQMLNLLTLNVNHIVLGYTKQLSAYHLDGSNRSVTEQLPMFRENQYEQNDGDFHMEPELVYFPNLIQRNTGNITSSSCLCIQGHPEWMDTDSPTVLMLQDLLNKWINPQKTPLQSLITIVRLDNRKNPVRVADAFHAVEIQDHVFEEVGGDFDMEEDEDNN